MEWPIGTPFRERQWVKRVAGPGRQSAGSALLGGLLHDATDSKRAEDSLRESEEKGAFQISG
jgi:hypothetical protein